ncbi:MAG TPA: esterase-like activity of phytase family protein [Allosphingosinicella sp.]|nr:esterase-like activity of phytase family protein [Allosphingosinicella sp.]
MAGLLLATNIRPGPPPPPPRPETVDLTFEAVALDEGDPAQRRAGSLLFLEGWAIGSESTHFGGISAMHVENGQVLALSDAGSVFRFALPGHGPARARLTPLPQGPGPAIEKSNRDTEALFVRGDELLVAYERANMIWRYRLRDLAALSAARPEAMRRWRGNAGPEAMMQLADGRYLVFSEGKDGGDTSEVALFGGDPSLAGAPTARLSYRRFLNYRITDAALLPDGRLLLLNRRFSLLRGFSAIVAVADPRQVRPGGTIVPRALATLASPLTVDNMEALSVTREGGRTIVWIASDDNFFPLQRTLLLKFALVE